MTSAVAGVPESVGDSGPDVRHENDRAQPAPPQPESPMITRFRSSSLVPTACVLALITVCGSAVVALGQPKPATPTTPQAGPASLRINDKDYFETRGLNVMVFSNEYNGMFFDREDVRTRNHPARGPYCPREARFVCHQRPNSGTRSASSSIARWTRPRTRLPARCRSDAFDFTSTLVVSPDGNGFRVAV